MKTVKELIWLEKIENYKKLTDITGKEHIVFAKPDNAKAEIKRGKYLMRKI
jgi:hypothetical protein